MITQRRRQVVDLLLSFFLFRFVFLCRYVCAFCCVVVCKAVVKERVRISELNAGFGKERAWMDEMVGLNNNTMSYRYTEC
jgi:hypothetical protein